MHLQMTVVWESGSRQPLEVAVEAPDGATSAQLLAALRDLSGPADSGWSLHAAGRLLSGAEPLGSGPLIDGAVLRLGRAREHDPGGPAPRASTTGPLTLAVVAGPDAGREFPLTPGTVRVGRASTADITLADPDLSRSHAALALGADGVWLTDCGSTNGTWADGRRVSEDGAAIDTTSTVALGSSLLQLRTPSRRPAAVAPARDGVRLVNRSPRTVRPVHAQTFTLPAPPQRASGARLPWVAMIAPVPVGIVLALLFSPVMLAFTLMTPLLMGATAVSDRVQGRRTYAVQLAQHAAAAARVRAAVAVAVAEEQRRRHRALPDPAEVLAAACTPSTRLWERRRQDPDMLELRLGTWTARTQVQVVDPSGDQPPECVEAPGSLCSILLDTVGVLGIAGPRHGVEAVTRSLVGQVATLHSPRDVDIWVIVASRAECAVWQWISRLPHNRCSGSLSRTSRRVAALDADEASLARAVTELQASVDERRRQHQPGLPWSGRRAVVLLDGAGKLRGTPGLARLFEEGPGVGVVFIALDRDPSRLPSECGAVLEVSTDARTFHLRNGGEQPGHGLVADRVGEWWTDRLSRALAPLRDATPEQAEQHLPDSVRLLDLLPADVLDPRSVADLWSRAPSSTVAAIGVSTEGTHCVDLRRDGPHILVGGTTGSGKSELLQALVVALATANRPDRLSFVLVDYKGGAAFKECAALPHTAGLVTDLDAHLTARALTSLNAELKRREALFADVGTRDIDEWESRAAEGQCAVPRLVIVIDEFRVLAEEFPEFISGLVRVAALGRSLGVHLVLATQRPAGVISPEIRSNVNLRVALRMRDRADSEDVIDSPAAAHISERTPGRALARTGTGPARAFQTARVGAAPSRAVPRLTVAPLDWGTGPRALLPEEMAEPTSDESSTDLSAAAASLREAASLTGIRPTPSPWLPPLPELVPAESLEAAGGSCSPWQIRMGLADRPTEQCQEVLRWDLRVPGHWAAVGTGASGRTSLLRLVAGEAARQLGPDQLHLYAVDGGRGGLQGLCALPHTGAVVPRDDHARVERLVGRLSAEVERRQRLLGELGLPSWAEWRDAATGGGAPPPPAVMLLLVDDWDLVAQTLDSTDHGALSGQILALLRDGASAGLRALVTGDRALLMGRVSSLFAERLVLHLSDPTDAVLAGVGRTALCDRRGAGRAVLSPEGTEVQLAFPRSPSAQDGGWAAVSAATHEGPPPVAPPGMRPLRVEPLPELVDLAPLLEGTASEGEAVVPLGLGGDDLGPLGLSPGSDGRLWLVAGPSRSGRSTALRSIGEVLLRQGHRLAIVSSRPGPLDALRGRGGVVCWTWPEDIDPLVGARQLHQGLAVLVDDADQVLDTPADPMLREVAREARRGRGLLVCAASTATLLTQFRGTAVEVARAQTGIMLNPQGPADAELFGTRAPRRLDRLPGRGLLVTRGTATEIQVAAVDVLVGRRPLPHGSLAG